MDYMDSDVLSLKKADKLNHSLTWKKSKVCQTLEYGERNYLEYNMLHHVLPVSDKNIYVKTTSYFTRQNVQSIKNLNDVAYIWVIVALFSGLFFLIIFAYDSLIFDQMAFHPGGHYWDYYTNILSFT